MNNHNTHGKSHAILLLIACLIAFFGVGGCFESASPIPLQEEDSTPQEEDPTPQEEDPLSIDLSGDSGPLSIAYITAYATSTQSGYTIVIETGIQEQNMTVSSDTLPNIADYFTIDEYGTVSSKANTKIPIGVLTINVVDATNKTRAIINGEIDLGDTISREINSLKFARHFQTTTHAQKFVYFDPANATQQTYIQYYYQEGEQVVGIKRSTTGVEKCYFNLNGVFPNTFTQFDDCQSVEIIDIDYERCVAEDGFIPSQYDNAGVANDGSSIFNNADQREQIVCFRAAFFQERLPKTAPDTPQQLINTLPDGLAYNKDQYRLVYHDEFNRPDTTTDYYIQEQVGDEWILTVQQGGPNSWFDEQERYKDKPYTWPIIIKDNMLHSGYGRHPKTDNPYITCSYADGVANFYHANTDKAWTGTTCACSATDWSAESCNNTVAHMVSKYYFRYGYIEIDVVSSKSVGHIYDYSIIDPFLSLPQVLSHTTSNARFSEFYTYSGGFPSFLLATNLKDELSVYGTEFQVMESRTYSTNGAPIAPLAITWLVLHYAKYPGAPYTRFFDSQIDFKPHSRKYGIEWTPRGYRIWFDGARVNPQEAFGNNGLCTDAHLGDNSANSFLECGVSHALQGVMQLHAAHQPGNINTQNPEYIKIDYIRLYKPYNDYIDMEPIYN